MANELEEPQVKISRSRCDVSLRIGALHALPDKGMCSTLMRSLNGGLWALCSLKARI